MSACQMRYMQLQWLWVCGGVVGTQDKLLTKSGHQKKVCCGWDGWRSEKGVVPGKMVGQGRLDVNLNFCDRGWGEFRLHQKISVEVS
jgi:hypothetical protein